jgi:hypothetical protein
VLHLGCVDTGLLNERFQRGELVHQRLSTVVTELWGVDIDADGISYLREQGFDHLFVGDICELGRISQLKTKSFDVILASEVIEHLQNPGLFLNSVKSLMVSGKTDLVITVPNAFRIDTLFWLLRGVEFVHPDHNYWFSYHTAVNLLRKNGFEIRRVYVYSFQPLHILPPKLRRLFRMHDGDSIGVDTKRASLASSAPLSQRSFRYLRSLPRRLAVSLLYHRTPFWGDGIIVVARLAKNASQ